MPVTDAEYASKSPCSFKDQSGGSASCQMEFPEHELVRQFIEPHMTVLELGARYGTTTFAIAAQQGNSGKLVAVAPDHRVWTVLDDNLKKHSCNAKVLRGVVGTVKRNVSEGGYGTRAAVRTHGPLVRRVGKNDALEAGEQGQTSKWHEQFSATPTPLSKLQSDMNMSFDTLLIDCEGCVEYFLQENPDVLKQVSTILMEADQGMYKGDKAHDCGKYCVDYERVVETFTSAGFEIARTFQEGHGVRASSPIHDCCPWIHHFVFRKKP